MTSWTDKDEPTGRAGRPAPPRPTPPRTGRAWASQLLRRRRRLRIAAIAASAALLSAGAGDLIATRAVSDRVAARAECALRTNRVSVSTGPWAPVGAVTDGDLGSVDLTAARVHRHGLTVSMTAHLHDVATDGRVGSSREDITVPYSSVMHGGLGGLGRAGGGLGGVGGQAAPGGGPTGSGPAGVRPSSVSGDGRYLLIGLDVPALGRTVTLAATVSAAGHEVTVDPMYLEVMGRALPVSEIEPLLAARNPAVAQELGPRHQKVTALPAGVHLDGVTPDSDGLHISAGTGPMSAASLSGRLCAGPRRA